MTSKRTSLKLSDDRLLLFDKAAEILKPPGDHVDPPRSDIIDAALTHLIQSEANLRDAKNDGVSPKLLKRFNTDVLEVTYSTRITPIWRK
jgi:hypothetical protein